MRLGARPCTATGPLFPGLPVHHRRRVRPQLARGRPGARACEQRPRGRRRPAESSGAAQGFATEGGGGLREEAEEERGKTAAVELEWIPETLYNTAISAVLDNDIRSRRDIRSLPENIQFAVTTRYWRPLARSPPQPPGRTPFHVRVSRDPPAPLEAGRPASLPAVAAFPNGGLGSWFLPAELWAPLPPAAP